MATKEEIIHDISIVTSFSSKYDMRESMQVARALKLFVEQDPFKTEIGKQYVERLYQVLDGKTGELCFICNRNLSHDGILCDECMDRYSHGSRRFFNPEDFAKRAEVPNKPMRPTATVRLHPQKDSRENHKPFRLWKVLVPLCILIALGVGAFLMLQKKNDEEALKDLSTYVGKFEDGFYADFDMNEFYVDELGFTKRKTKKNPGVLIDPDGMVYCVTLFVEHEDYEKFSVYGIEIGNTKSQVRQKLDEFEHGKISTFDNDDDWVCPLTNGYMVEVKFASGTAVDISLMDESGPAY